MNVQIAHSMTETGRLAAAHGAGLIAAAIDARGHAAIVVATGSSQFSLYDDLVGRTEIDWRRVTAFHLDEYIGLSGDHPASFRRYLRERLVERLPVPLERFVAIDGNAGPESECARLKGLIAPVEIDVAFVGIGENGHLAFNDPPADFETDEPYLVVTLDEACRRQQLSEGWFPRFDDVPERAISMSVRQIMKARAIVCTVPEARKAVAVKKAIDGPVTPDLPASILQRHGSCLFIVDGDSAALLGGKGDTRS